MTVMETKEAKFPDQLYRIELGDQVYDCLGYDRIKVSDVPVRIPVKKEKRKDFIDFLFGSDYYYKNEVIEIEMLRLKFKEEGRKNQNIYVATSREEVFVREAVNRGKADRESSLRSYNEWLEGLSDWDRMSVGTSWGPEEPSKVVTQSEKWYSSYENRGIVEAVSNRQIVTVDSLDAVLAQFAQQDKKCEADIKRKQGQLENRIQKKADKITEDFNRERLLCDETLTTRGKCEEYKRVREFCLRYLPELSDRNFQIEDLHKQYPKYVDENQCHVFAKNWAKLSAAYYKLERGLKGEDKVAEVLQLYDDRLCFLQNYHWGYEHDFIILAPSGIFTVEVKTLSGSYTLMENGVLKRNDSRKNQWEDVAFQSKKHIETLRRNLKGCPAFTQDTPLQEIICSAEPEFTIKNEYNIIPVCYPNTIDRILLPTPVPKAVLTPETIKELRSYLLAHQEEERRYAVFAPDGDLDSRSKFIQSFAAVAGGIACSRNS